MVLWEEVRFTLLFVTHSIEEALVLGSRVLLAASGPRARRAERAGAQPAQPGLGGLPGGHAAHSRSAVRPGARAGKAERRVAA